MNIDFCGVSGADYLSEMKLSRRISKSRMTSTNNQRVDVVRARPTVLLIAGFGDDSSMFAGLLETTLADAYDLLAIDLPGFGAPRLQSETTLKLLGEFVSAKAKEVGAEIVIAHSVASIIASLAANEPNSPITTILSLEGNITAEDAYFSGSAADYDDPDTFRSVFLTRLEEMSKSQPMIARYLQVVSQADPIALWQLGNDAHRFSSKQVPGEVLVSAANVTYLYNPDNCAKSSLDWLKKNPVKQVKLDNATHWKSVDQPALLAEKILSALE
ncbi:alpha/beta fold hydrolase [Marinicella sp. W31]|uniref:alpha/beta hydrolase n=1 Tax=Marinicella sp. W31 TaxID=3023713 RepID=UPI00375753F1